MPRYFEVPQPRASKVPARFGEPVKRCKKPPAKALELLLSGTGK